MKATTSHEYQKLVVRFTTISTLIDDQNYFGIEPE